MKKSILAYLEESVVKYPNKKAFADRESSCTYKELQENAKIIGSALVRRVEVRSPIPIVMEKSVAAVTTFLGAAYAGCFYTLLDIKHPITRLNQIIETIEPQVIVVDKSLLEEAKKLSFNGQILCYQELLYEAIDEEILHHVREQMQDIDPLYTNFTSGSTGIPKGVVVSHRSVIDFIDYFPELFGITEKDIIGNQAPFDFDVSVKDIYTTLKVGGTMEIIPRQLFSFPAELLDYICEREITTLIWAVSALCIITTLKGLKYKVPTKLKNIIFSGETMPIKHLNEWRKYLPDVTYVNVYGPTEITCNCTYYIVDREFEIGEVLPMGKPFPNEKVFLLDEDNQLVDENNTGVNGEICVSGTALALGYYNNMEQTKKVFVQNPLNKKYLEMIYRTGDLGYYNERKEMCFASRKDFQIKHMGHRIELGEIEVAIDMVEGVVRNCCIYHKEKSKIIVFYEGDVDKKQIQSVIVEKIPNYMVPNTYVNVDAMLLTKNGKIDRQGLLKGYLEGR